MYLLSDQQESAAELVEDRHNNSAIEQPSLEKRCTKGRSREIRKERKISRNTGKAYETETGKKIPARTFKSLENCRNKCCSKLSTNAQKTMFDKYWGMGDRNRRASFISGLISFSSPKASRKRRNTPEKQKNRQVTFTYHIPIDGEQVKLCKSCFLRVFDETPKFVWVLCKQKQQSPTNYSTPDKRGMLPPPNKITDEQLNAVQEHLASLPAYESHYCRKETSKKYLPPYFTVTKTYNMYCETTEKPISYTKYLELFKKSNIAIKSPKKDTCQACDKYNMQLTYVNDEERTEILKQQEDHHNEAEIAYETKKRDKQRAKTEDNFTVLAFDLQQCLPTPSIETSVVFYKRQLWTFNLTVHNMKSDKATCFVWYESVAKRGANEIGSCVFKAVENLPQNIKHVILYSDTCPGQNKNSLFLAMCVSVVKNTHVEIVDHKFMVPGHSRMECDSDHAQIEKFKKRHDTPISHSHDWAQMIRLVNKKNPFSVIELDQNDFLDYASLLKTEINMNKSNETGEKCVWREVKWLKIKPQKVFYKRNLKEDEPFATIDIARRNKPNPQLHPPACYNAPIPIAPEKKKDLLTLLRYIPPVFHEFYNQLPTTNSEYKDPILESDTDEN